jgi:alpha-beta hydrolase superfamily lysophospholipase
MGVPTYVEGELSLARGGKLFTVKYLPAEGTPLKAVLVFHHGYGEHVGRYTDGALRSGAELTFLLFF